MTHADNQAAGRRIIWKNVLTVMSAAVLIGVEVFGGAFAMGWALANLFQLGAYVEYVLQGFFFFIGLFVMAQFLRNARKVEPFIGSR